MTVTKDMIWNVGHVMALICGTLVAFESNIAFGIAFAFFAGLLVDIRRELSELTECGIKEST